MRREASLGLDKEGEKAERSGVLGEEKTLPVSLRDPSWLEETLRLDALLRKPDTEDVNERFDCTDGGRDACTWKLEEAWRR